jgi:hypothetical protein
MGLFLAAGAAPEASSNRGVTFPPSQWWIIEGRLNAPFSRRRRGSAVVLKQGEIGIIFVVVFMSELEKAVRRRDKLSGALNFLLLNADEEGTMLIISSLDLFIVPVGTMLLWSSSSEEFIIRVGAMTCAMRTMLMVKNK